MVDKNTVDRWTDIQFVVTPGEKTKKIPVTTDKEMFSSSPEWKVINPVPKPVKKEKTKKGFKKQ